MPKVYKASTDLITGDKLMLFVTNGSDVDPVAFGTSCGIQLSADTIDTSSKMSGDWKEFLVGQLGYTVSCESLLSKTTGHVSFKTLKTLMASRTPIPFIMGKAVKTGDDFTKGEEFVKGYAIITELSMTAENGSICSSSISMQGTGELEDGTITP
ncbi:hypothetical protein JGH11_10870 [Dysgonomonas sp. Marseille-P4677]|uniref:phage tail tube protein n=1 Tax=Dysgonomonas sp. Marseille-P4677 TaxID=2364790 RepID=UPI001913A485|nr:phage tail tube protein [Dysgonomonas sp. Marseille-P4677]MBK5721375.1 hypothetical protein [Dysgonomonas sp. Marseille-P4677]